MAGMPATIEHELGQLVTRAARSALGVDVDDPLVRPSGNEKFGDYQTTLAMSLAKEVGRPPREIADAVVDALDGGEIVSSASVAGPGFVNFELRDAWLLDRVREAADDERLGIPAATATRRVVVDYSAPNVAKEMHVGHLRSTIIGDALVRMLRFAGHEAIPQNHVGDWGTPFGMLLEEMADRGLGGPDLEISDLNAFYQEARSRFDGDPGFAQRARERVVKLQTGDPETRRLWDELVAESERHFMTVYDLLGVCLGPEDMAGESRYDSMLEETIEELRHKGLLKLDQGAWVVSPPGFTGREGQPAVLIVQKSDGGYTYAATDLAAVRYRFTELGATDALYVVGAPQSMHFAMVFATAETAGWIGPGKHAEHVPFGSVLGEDGKMLRTRSGEPIRLVDLLREAIERAERLVRERSGDELPADIARAVGVGSLKYADLVNDRERDYVFSWDRMLALDGNTGVYLQYAVARIRSMLERAGEDVPSEWPADAAFTHPAERALALRVAAFPTALEKALGATKPHVLARQLYDVATSFSGFYENCPVLKAEGDTRELRLMLSVATERTLATGLSLLGIDAPRRL